MPNQAGLLDHQQVDGEQHAAAEIADGVSGRRHAVELLLADQVRQQRLVEHDAAGDADVAEDEQHQREQPVAARESSTSPASRRRRSPRKAPSIFFFIAA